MQICGEHKESGILRHGYLASPFFKDTGLTEVEEKCGGKMLLLFEHVVKIYCYFGTTLPNFK